MYIIKTSWYKLAARLSAFNLLSLPAVATARRIDRYFCACFLFYFCPKALLIHLSTDIFETFPHDWFNLSGAGLPRLS